MAWKYVTDDIKNHKTRNDGREVKGKGGARE